MYAKQAQEVREQVLASLPENVTFDVAEDIASDVLLKILERGMPKNLRGLIETFKEKHTHLYLERCVSGIGWKRPPDVIDENSSPAPFEYRVYVD